MPCGIAISGSGGCDDRPRLRDGLSYLLSATSVGPDLPAGSRLGPERWNSLVASSPTPKVKPTKQLLISSQFCGPHRTSLAGSGLNALLAELSKCEIPIRRVPLGSGMGFSKL